MKFGWRLYGAVMLGSIFLLASCAANDDDGDASTSGETAAADEQTRSDASDGEPEAEEEPTEAATIPPLEENPEPHEMTHWNKSEYEWYAFSPSDYHDATTWEASDSSLEYGTSAEEIAEYSCGLGERHYQGTWYLDAPLGYHVPADYQARVNHFQVYEGEDTQSGLPEVQVFIALGCSTWEPAVESLGINPDLYPRQVIISEEAAASLLDLDGIAEAILNGLVREPREVEPVDIRSEDIGEVYYRVQLYPDE